MVLVVMGVENMTNILLTLLASLAVGMLFFKLKVPGGVLVGGIIGTTIFSMATGMAEMPFTARLIAQIIAGALSEARLTEKI